MDLGEYARIYVETYGKSGAELDGALATFGRTKAWFDQARQAVDARARVDTKVAAEVNARVTIASARRTRAALPPLAIAKRVRARQCPRCGGYKRTVPRTAYVYCDYCGVLFDYDEDLARKPRGGVESMHILRILTDGVRAEIVRAWNAGDEAAYRQAWRWPYEMDMILCPENWSPRNGDPAYRRAMIDFSVGVTVLHNRDETRREASILRGEAREEATRAPGEHTLRRFLARTHDLLRIEEAAFRRAGLFEIHPDALDPGTYYRINMVLAVMDWSQVLSDEHFGLLLAISKISTERLECEPAAFGQATCGHCGERLLLMEGARSVVCEACGHCLNCQLAYPCTHCGAPLLAAPDGSSVKCAWCSTLMSFVR